jgi:hypothetical protein
VKLREKIRDRLFYAMKLNHQIKYIACVAVAASIAVTLAFTMQYSINEEVGLVLSGGSVAIYLGLARLFRGGDVFNIILLIVVFAGYIAAFLAPLYYIFRSFKWPLVFLQIGLIIVHFLIGLAFLI